MELFYITDLELAASTVFLSQLEELEWRFWMTAWNRFLRLRLPRLVAYMQERLEFPYSLEAIWQ